jgi:hypothetical protein
MNGVRKAAMVASMRAVRWVVLSGIDPGAEEKGLTIIGCFLIVETSSKVFVLALSGNRFWV